MLPVHESALPRCRCSAFSRLGALAGATFTLLALIPPAALAASSVSETPIDLLRPASGPILTPPSPGTTHSRLVDIDPVALEALRSGDSVRLELFDGVVPVIVLEEQPDVPFPSRGFVGTPTETNEEGDSIEAPSADAVMVVRPGVLVASVHTASLGLVRIRPDHDGLHVLERIDAHLLPDCGTDQEFEVKVPGLGDGGLAPADDADRFDLLVVWTTSAQNAAGGIEAMNALVDLAILETNLAYQDSGVNSRVRVVHKSKIAYDESGDFGAHLSRLTGTSDGYMDQVHALRTATGADQVTLLVQDGQYCGIAYLMTNLSNGFKTSAFSVVNYGCATGYYSFGHELGHNQGCHHDHDNGSGALYPYSYGYRFYGNSGNQYRTMLAYSPGTRIRRLSNPNATYDGVPTGVPGTGNDAADNSRSLNNAASTVANWYGEKDDTATLLFSLRNDATVNGLALADEDVARLDVETGAVSLILDLSDLVPASANLDALSATASANQFLMSFDDTLDVPGLTGGPNGATVEPQDLVLLTVTQYGATTQGSFSFFFDGSDVGLDSASENIDGVSIDAAGDLFLTFTGKYDVGGGFSGRDEDVLVFSPTNTGSNTAGSYFFYFDGSASDAKLNGKGEDVDALHRSGVGLVVSTAGKFRIPTNRVGEDDDLLQFLPTGFGASTAGTWMNLLNGEHYGLANADIDALHLE